MTLARKRTLAVAWALLIVAACTIPGTDLPKIDIDWIDKVAHVALFGVLAWLWLDTSSASLGKRIAVVILAGAAFGVLTEIYQGLLPWERTPDIYDAAANTVGLCAGSAAFVARGRFFGNG